jgi:hypothetical protein
LIAWDRLRHLIIVSGRALLRAVLDQPRLGRDAESPVVVHPAALGKRRTVGDFDVASDLIRVRAFHAVKEAFRAPLDSLVRDNRMLIGRSAFTAWSSIPTAASQHNREKRNCKRCFHAPPSTADDIARTERPCEHRTFATARRLTIELGEASTYGIGGSAECAEAGTEVCDLSQGIEVDDGTGTITIHLGEADPDFLHKLAFPSAFVVPAGTPPRMVTLRAQALTNRCDTDRVGTGTYPWT